MQVFIEDRCVKYDFIAKVVPHYGWGVAEFCVSRVISPGSYRFSPDSLTPFGGWTRIEAKMISPVCYRFCPEETEAQAVT